MPHRQTLLKNSAYNKQNCNKIERGSLLERRNREHYIDPAIIPYRRLNAECFDQIDPINNKQKALLVLIFLAGLGLWTAIFDFLGVL